MRVLGIDPGSSLTGYGVVEDGERIPRIVASGVIRAGSDGLPARLTRIFAGLEDILTSHRPDAVAVESVFTARNVKSAMVLGHARGVVLLAAGRAGLAVFEYPPREVKQTVTGFGGAEKEQVRRVLELTLGPLPEGLDVSDAVAVAICHLQCAKLPSLAHPRRPARVRKESR